MTDEAKADQEATANTIRELRREVEVLREAYRSLRMLRLDMWDGENLDASSVAIAAVEAFDKERR